MTTELPRNWTAFRRDWHQLTAYELFEAIAAGLLTAVIGGVIIIALGRLIVGVVDTLILKSLDPLDHAVFQRVFDQIMTVLIALEFNHTLQYAIAGKLGIIQGRIVIVIALLAIARKVIITDFTGVSPALLGATAALAAALGVTYWLMAERPGRS